MVFVVWSCRVLSASLLGLAFLCGPFYINFYADKDIPLESYSWVFVLVPSAIVFRVMAGVASLIAYVVAYEKLFYKLVVELTMMVYCVVGILCAFVIGIVSMGDVVSEKTGLFALLDPESIFPTSIMIMVDLSMLLLIIEEWLKLRARMQHVKVF